MSNVRQPVTGGLSLPSSVGVGESQERRLHQQWDTIEEIEQKLLAEGFQPMAQPEFGCPQITEDTLTTADSKAYTGMYAQQLAWFYYASQALSRCSAELLQVTNEMSLIEATMRKGFRDRMKAGGKAAKMSAEEMGDLILLDPRYSYLLHRKQELTQYKLELGTYTENIDRGMKVISRQVELRKMELEQSRINIPNRGYGIRGTGG
jgi:hypothetical protein